MAHLEPTTLNRPWLAKMIIFFGVLVFFGFYGLYDATIAYPNRGIRHAAFCEYQYLDAANQQRLLDRRVSIADPEAEFRRLREAERAGGSRLTELDSLRLAWLRSLSMVGRLQPRFTTIEDPQARFAELTTQWTTAQGAGKNAPKALAAYDIPVQWVFVVVGFGGGLWMAGLFLSVKRIQYRWDAETQTLYLPASGRDHTLTPADIEEFDKRKWDKFLVFLKIRPDHATLGGRELRLDLYRYGRLENWILAMEKTAFPENEASEESQELAEVTP
jgi:hypothetical protein